MSRLITSAAVVVVALMLLILYPDTSRHEKRASVQAATHATSETSIAAPDHQTAAHEHNAATHADEAPAVNVRATHEAQSISPPHSPREQEIAGKYSANGSEKKAGIETEAQEADAEFMGCLACAANDHNHREIHRLLVTSSRGTLWYEGGGDFRIIRHLVVNNLLDTFHGAPPEEDALYEIHIFYQDGSHSTIGVGQSWIASGDRIGPAHDLLVGKLEASTKARAGQEIPADTLERMLAQDG